LETRNWKLAFVIIEASMSDANSTKRSLEIEVPAEVVSRETAAILAKYQKMARLPGFRRGKVPASVLRQRFGNDIRSEVVESLVPRFFREEARKQGLQPVSQPQVTDLQLEEGQPLRFKAEFEVLPEVDISGYENLQIEKPDTNVTDDEVNAALERLREQQAAYTAVDEDRALTDGDFAQVSLSGAPQSDAPAASPEATPSEAQKPAPVHMDEVLVEVGGQNTVREFSENLRGARAGEERAFDVTYPEDAPEPRLAGKTLTYTLKVLGIKRKSTPELNDDFARELSNDLQTLDDLRKRIREGLEQEKRHEAEHRGKESILEQLVQRHDFPVPESMVARQIDVRLERGLRALAAQGMTAEQMRKMDLDRLRAGQREAATKEVKSTLILDRIADKENITISDEELNRELEALSQQSRQPLETLRTRLEQEGTLERLRSRLRTDKALDVLYRRSA
jgi:trigger factor